MSANLSHEDLDVIAHALQVMVRKYRGTASAAKGENSSSKSPQSDYNAAMAQKELFQRCLDKVNAERTKDGRKPPKHLIASSGSITVTF